MYKINSIQRARANSHILGLVARANSFGEGDSVPINQNPSQSFNINPDTGRPMSVITALLRSQNAAEQLAILNGLDEFKSTYLPDGISNEDAIKYMVPRYCQLPSQIAKFNSELKAEKDLLKLKEDQDENNKKLEESAPATTIGDIKPSSALAASASAQ